MKSFRWLFVFLAFCVIESSIYAASEQLTPPVIAAELRVKIERVLIAKQMITANMLSQAAAEASGLRASGYAIDGTNRIQTDVRREFDAKDDLDKFVTAHGLNLTSALAKLSFDDIEPVAKRAREILTGLEGKVAETLLAIAKTQQGDLQAACWLVACQLFSKQTELPPAKLIEKQISEQSQYCTPASQLILKSKYEQLRKQLVPDFRFGLSSSSDFAYRQNCVLALASIEPLEEESLLAIVACLKDGGAIRSVAKYRIAALGEKAREATPYLVAWLSQHTMDDVLHGRQGIGTLKQSTPFRRMVADLLVKISPDPKYASYVVEVLLNPYDGAVRRDAAKVLQAMGPSAVAQLHEHVRGESRKQALDAITLLRAEDEQTARLLATLLSDQSFDQRNRAATALKAMGPHALFLFDQIYPITKEKNPPYTSRSERDVARAAAGVLVSMKPGAEYAPKLLEMMRNGNREIRGYASSALQNMGGDAKQVLPQVIANLNSGNRDLQFSSMKIIRGLKVSDPAVIKLLANILANSRGSWNRQLAAETLVDLDQAARPVKSVLQQSFLKDNDRKVRLACLRGLIQLGECDEALLQALKELRDNRGPREMEYYAYVALDLFGHGEPYEPTLRKLKYAADQRDSWLAGAAALCLIERGEDTASYKRRLRYLPKAEWNRERLAKSLPVGNEE